MNIYEIIDNVIQNTTKSHSYLICGMPKNKNNYFELIDFLKKSINDEFDFYFKDKIPLEVDFKFIDVFEREFVKMDLMNIKYSDVILYSNSQDNKLFVDSLNRVIKHAIENKDANETTITDFVTNMLLWSFQILSKKSIHNFNLNKFIYEKADLTKRECYFLLLIHLMNINVIIFNMTKECNFTYIFEPYFHININEFDYTEEKDNGFMTVDSVLYSAKSEIDRVFMENQLHTSWQLKDYDLEIVGINSVFKDVKIYWPTVLKSRQGYFVDEEEHKVYIPRLFLEVVGINNENEHLELIEMLEKDENTVVSTSGNNQGLFSNVKLPEERFELIFMMKNDTLIDIDEIQKSHLYKYGHLEQNVQNLIMKRASTFLDEQKMFKHKLLNNDLIDLLYCMLNLPKEVIDLIVQFDYTNINPKLVYVIDENNQLSNLNLNVLMFLSYIGFDVLLINLDNSSRLHVLVENEYFSLDKLSHISPITWDDIKTKNNKSFFARLFNY